ncbi:unnamed protein product [Ambrosiozyma monospora]|uniref:Unnamed protein product n=1 Tax=Ambrosiozyma monospora TaxID=43982 RepID=A0ACB5T3T3_AMBMO|nr:unnamed protein product [Ambrosiozyma monospora]
MKFIFPDQSHEFQSIAIAGSFNEWSPNSNKLHYNANSNQWEIQLDSQFKPNEKILFKFIVNGDKWTCSSDYEIESDDHGHPNNTIIVNSAEDTPSNSKKDNSTSVPSNDPTVHDASSNTTTTTSQAKDLENKPASIKPVTVAPTASKNSQIDKEVSVPHLGTESHVNTPKEKKQVIADDKEEKSPIVPPTPANTTVIDSSHDHAIDVSPALVEQELKESLSSTSSLSTSEETPEGSIANLQDLSEQQTKDHAAEVKPVAVGESSSKSSSTTKNPVDQANVSIHSKSNDIPNPNNNDTKSIMSKTTNTTVTSANVESNENDQPQLKSVSVEKTTAFDITEKKPVEKIATKLERDDIN